LSLVPNVGPVMSPKLLAEMEGAEQIFRAGMKDLLELCGRGKQTA
jgi:ERCC4-type nuclease